MSLKDFLNDIKEVTGYTEEQLRTEKRDLMLFLYEFTKLNREDQREYVRLLNEIKRNKGI